MKQRTVIDYRKRICEAMNFISQNLDKDLSLEEIAQAASFSMFHFHRIFKSVVGETVAAFTRRLRLEMAANRLISSQYDDVTMIAMDYGFSSSQNFAKAFRQHFGMSPSQYRKSKIGNNFGKDGYILSKSGNALSLQTVHNFDHDFINLIKHERNKEMKAEIKEMPDYNVAYVRKIGSYGRETCGQGFMELMKWASSQKLKSSAVLGVYWDNPDVTSSEKCRFDACIDVPKGTVSDAPVGMQVIKGGSYAVCHFEISSDAFPKAWEDAMAWVIESGCECDEKPIYELYHNNAAEHPEGKWIVDICIPLKG